MAVVAGVRQAMRGQPQASMLERLTALLRPAVVAPAAVLMIIVAAFGLLRYDQNAVTTPAFSTSYFVRQHVAHTLGSPASDRAWNAYLLTSVDEPADSSTGAAPNN
jgi:phosphoglycerol transferase MdoB-like AlkP superfamily enzyme